MRIVIPGGSGQVGQMLARHFHQKGDTVVVLARKPAQSPWRTVHWNGRDLDRSWTQELEGADVVINLAGRSVNCRYTEAEPARDYGTVNCELNTTNLFPKRKRLS